MCRNAGASGDGGMGSRAFNSLSQPEKMQVVSAAQKELRNAKTAETKAYKQYMTVSGAYRAVPKGKTDLKSERLKAMTAAHEKYISAKDKKERLEKRLDRYRRLNSRQRSFF